MGTFDVAPLERARQLAEQAHAGQVDKAGEPYIAHPYRVMALVVDLESFAALSASEREVALVAALLHDVVEDTEVSLGDLSALFSDVSEVVPVVDALTHRRGESRLDYYGRVNGNKVARVVKFADLLDNTDPVRLDLLDEATRSRLGGKYAAAFEALRFPVPRHLALYA